MSARQIYEYLERIANLLRAEARQTEGLCLQPVQLQILHYLSICNRHSNIPAAVTQYLGLTKGTVSQTLCVLENKGYIEKTPDDKDKRTIHLHLTPKGKALVATAWPLPLLKAAIDQMSPPQKQQLTQGLDTLLKAMQSAHRFRTFGVCRTCRHLRWTEEGHYCGLTKLPLAAAELELICREHLPSEPSADQVA